MSKKLSLSQRINNRIMLPGFAGSLFIPAWSLEAIYPVFIALGLHLATQGAKKYEAAINKAGDRVQNFAKNPHRTYVVAPAMTAKLQAPISPAQAVRNMEEMMKVTAVEVTAAGIGTVYHLPLAEQLPTMGAYYLAMTYGTYALGCGIIKLHETGAQLVAYKVPGGYGHITLPLAQGLRVEDIVYAVGYGCSVASRLLYRNSASIGAFAKLLTAGRVLNHASERVEAVTEQAAHYAGEIPVLGGWVTETVATGGMWVGLGAVTGIAGLVVQRAARPIVEQYLAPFAQKQWNIAKRQFKRNALACQMVLSVHSMDVRLPRMEPQRPPIPAFIRQFKLSAA